MKCLRCKRSHSIEEKVKTDGWQLIVHDADERSNKLVQISKEGPVPETPPSEASPVATES